LLCITIRIIISTYIVVYKQEAYVFRIRLEPPIISQNLTHIIST
jgi:hypothetical protein